MVKAIENPIVKRMYQLPFKEYMMNDFMHYFGVDNWSTSYPLDNKSNLRNVKPKWMRQFGALMVNHGIQKEGLNCQSCHSDHGILDFKKPAYSSGRVKDLQHLPELKYFKKENIGIAGNKNEKDLAANK